MVKHGIANRENANSNATLDRPKVGIYYKVPLHLSYVVPFPSWRLKHCSPVTCSNGSKILQNYPLGIYRWPWFNAKQGLGQVTRQQERQQLNSIVPMLDEKLSDRKASTVFPPFLHSHVYPSVIAASISSVILRPSRFPRGSIELAPRILVKSFTDQLSTNPISFWIPSKANRIIVRRVKTKFKRSISCPFPHDRPPIATIFKVLLSANSPTLVFRTHAARSIHAYLIFSRRFQTRARFTNIE